MARQCILCQRWKQDSAFYYQAKTCRSCVARLSAQTRKQNAEAHRKKLQATSGHSIVPNPGTYGKFTDIATEKAKQAVPVTLKETAYRFSKPVLRFYGAVLAFCAAGGLFGALEQSSGSLLLCAVGAAALSYVLLSASREQQEFIASKTSERETVYSNDLTKRLGDYDEHHREYGEFYLTPEWRALREQVIRRDGSRCKQCGRTVHGDLITVDHIKPRSVFPHLALDIDNLQVLCRGCNSSKGASTH